MCSMDRFHSIGSRKMKMTELTPPLQVYFDLSFKLI
uniref:Uncharacterized protein n=1 Tax=Arundo donax TaxID=35708 RepID=A0A0A8XV57_ARUDO